MMKKLVVLVMVLGMASLASAALQISVNGNTDPVDSQIFLQPSGTLELDIHSYGGNTGIGEGETFFFALISDMRFGVVDAATGVTHIGPAPDASVLLGLASASGVTGLPASTDGLLGSVGAFTAEPPYADGIYFDGITFTCVAPGDVTIYLAEVSSQDFSLTGVIYDSVVVHQVQVPEPATMVLLGLGGLLLRRRK